MPIRMPGLGGDDLRARWEAVGLDLEWSRPLVSALLFWCAIALPALYVPLLVVGIDSVSRLLVFFGLFGLHVVALIGGHSYNEPSSG